jgi:hypothetical protein
MRRCVLVDLLGAKAICRPEILSGWYGEYVLGKFSR